MPGWGASPGLGNTESQSPAEADIPLLFQLLRPLGAASPWWSCWEAPSPPAPVEGAVDTLSLQLPHPPTPRPWSRNLCAQALSTEMDQELPR